MLGGVEMLLPAARASVQRRRPARRAPVQMFDLAFQSNDGDGRSQ